MESLSFLDTAEKGNQTNNGTELPQNNNPYFELDAQEMALIIIPVFIFVISIFGLTGNGTVVWFLGFRMNRNPFTTFILNLAIADLGVLICTISLMIVLTVFEFSPTLESIAWLTLLCISTFFFYITGQFLLTAISVDRCVSVLFPIWHRCHRPQHLSTIVCALIWILTFLSIGLCSYASLAYLFEKQFFFLFVFLIPPVLCFPLMIISTVILLIKVCFRSQQRKKGRVLRAILLALLFFLFFAFTFSFMILLLLLGFDISEPSLIVGHLCSCLNSSVNPLIYFLVGRKKHSRSKESMKVALQRLFKEEEHGRAELELQVRNQI
ncbi:mas-related G-protein coupled receptor member H-like [Lacerta agilis]|uniref:mas-related G-protein coupled receptor member H-like n=1 Tax=Lacerta agilis TaxID=80427 RepID=UPI0014197F67|nr:mas-related G-protein coupled receptor member H-like [Lacerta agilis]